MERVRATRLEASRTNHLTRSEELDHADWNKFPSHLSLPGESGDYASTPDAAALDITGDIDLRAAVAMDDWTPVFNPRVIAKDGSSGGGYELGVGAGTGDLFFGWGDGTSETFEFSTVALAVSDGDFLLIRATLDVDNGAGAYEVKFYTKSSTPADAATDLVDNTGWMQLGTTVTGGATTVIGTNTNNLALGSRQDGTSETWSGKHYAAAVLDGIDGTVAFNADFTAEVPGTTSFTEDSANAATVTINQSGDPQAEIVSPVTVTADAATAPDGATTADNLSDTSALAHGSASQVHTVADDSLNHPASVHFAKKQTDHIAMVALEYTGGTTELTYEAEINLNGGDTDVSNSPDAPTRVVVEDWGDFWRVSVVGANNGTGNTTATTVAYPHVGTTLGTRDVSVTGDVDVWGAQLEDGPFPSSYISTTSAADTRAADSAEEDTAFDPQTLTAYAKIIERGNVMRASGRAPLLRLGGNDFNVTGVSGSGYRLSVVQNTTGDMVGSKTIATAPTFGAVVELRAIIQSDGTILIGQSIDGGTEETESGSIGTTLDSAWDEDTVDMRPSTVSFADYVALTISSGVKTMDEMRSLADSRSGDLYSYYPGDTVDSFSRSSVATYRDEDANLSTASSGVIRDDTWVGTQITVDVAEALSLDDTASATMQVIADNLETAAFADTVEALFEFGGSVTEGMSVADVVNASMVVAGAIAEGMTFSEAIVLLFDVEVSEGVTVGDVWEVLKDVESSHSEAAGIGDSYAVSVAAAGTLRTVSMEATIRDAAHIYAPIREDASAGAEIHDEVKIYAPFIGE